MDLFQTIGYSILEDSHIPLHDSISLRLISTNDTWMLQNVLTRVIRESGYTAFITTDTLSMKSFLMVISASSINAHYDNMFKDGLFGSKKVRRTLSVRLTSQLINSTTNEVLYSNSPVKVVTDTVLVDDIPMLERDVPTHGRAELPSEMFFDRAVEPLLIIGATGIAVFLLFHVRS